MIRAITGGALWLDLWLQEKLGRPYNIVLSVGLVTEIIHRLTELPKRIASASQLVPTVLVILFECALLIHQVGELSHRPELAHGHRPSRRRPRRSRTSRPSARRSKLPGGNGEARARRNRSWPRPTGSSSWMRSHKGP